MLFRSQRIIKDTVVVEVDSGGSTWETFSIKDTLAFSEDADKDCFFEYDDQLYSFIIFGDGVQGEKPTIGINNLRVSYAYGGGILGNGYIAGQLNQLLDTITEVASVTNIGITTGGLEGEDVAVLKRKLPFAWSKLDRAVTLNDYEQVAVDGGAEQAKASMSESVVNIYITAGDKSAILDYVNKRALPNVQHVIKDVYTVDVDAIINIVQRAASGDKATVIAAVEAALDTKMFDILKLNEGVYLGDVYQIVEGVEGVDHSTISKFTRVPYARPSESNAGTATIVVTLSSAVSSKLWTLTIIGATTFKIVDNLGVLYNGTFGVDLVIPNEITVNITAGTDVGDKWYIRTSPWAGNIIVDPLEILQAGTISVV